MQVRKRPADRAAVLDAIATPAAPSTAARHDPRPLQGRHPPRTPHTSSATPPGQHDRPGAGNGRLAAAGQPAQERVAAAVDAFAATGRELSIAAIARHANVSRKFVYTHPELRAQIEQRARSATRSLGQADANGRVTVASLRADLANAKAHNQRLRQRLRALEHRLSEALGRDLADQLEPRAEPEELRGQLQDAKAQIFELQEQLAEAREELDAVREINRELLTDHNRPAR
jgi:small-conductance mechanosensitive channel